MKFFKNSARSVLQAFIDMTARYVPLYKVAMCTCLTPDLHIFFLVDFRAR
jgi:hypothetical protein